MLLNRLSSIGSGNPTFLSELLCVCSYSHSLILKPSVSQNDSNSPHFTTSLTRPHCTIKYPAMQVVTSVFRIYIHNVKQKLVQFISTLQILTL